MRKELAQVDKETRESGTVCKVLSQSSVSILPWLHTRIPGDLKYIVSWVPPTESLGAQCILEVFKGPTLVDAIAPHED